MTENGSTSAIFLRENDPDPSPPARGIKSLKRKLFTSADNKSKPEDADEGSKEKYCDDEVEETVVEVVDVGALVGGASLK